MAVRRRICAGGPPVVFFHGLAVNANLWDLPEVRGRDFHYRSLASLLHERGWDVWLANLRGHGAPHMLSRPPRGQRDWCADHFVLYDLPAAIEGVAAVTGRRPLVIAASMGAIALAGYLQGARWEESGRIVADAGLGRRRQAGLAGAVFVEFPARLRWPKPLFDARGRVRWGCLARHWYRQDADANFPFELAARIRLLMDLLQAAGKIPVHWLVPQRTEPWYRRLPAGAARAAECVERAAIARVLQLAGTFTGATHHRAEVFVRGRRHVLDDMQAGVLRQMSKCVRQGALVSLLGRPDHVYSDHYESVELPVQVVQGGRDRIACAAVTRAEFFERIRSADKEFRLYPEVAHGELEAAPIACEQAYPAMVAWAERHRG